MGRSRFYVSTVNTKGSSVRTGTGNKGAEVILGLETMKNTEEMNQAINVRLNEDRKGNLIVSVFPKTVQEAYTVILEDNKPLILKVFKGKVEKIEEIPKPSEAPIKVKKMAKNEAGRIVMIGRR